MAENDSAAIRLFLVTSGLKGETEAHNAQVELGRTGSKYSLEHVAKRSKTLKFIAPNGRDFIYKFADESTLYLFEEGDMALVQDHDVSKLQEIDLFVWKARR